MPDFEHYSAADLMSRELEDWGARTGADVGAPHTSGLVLHVDEDLGLEIGIWACTPGGWSITDRPDSETVHIMGGRCRLTNVDGTSRELGPGDSALLPRGWSGRWDILEPLRKFYLTVK